MTDLLALAEKKPLSVPATTAAIMVALRERYCSPEFAFFENVGDSGSNSRVYADGVSMNMWASRGYALTGFEVKASRSDWLRELKQPGKSEPVLTRCDFWYLVAPDEVFILDEVPVSWGVLAFKDGKLRERRKAPKLEPKPITRAFVSQMFRRLHEQEERDISAQVGKALAADRDAYNKRLKDEVERRTRDLQKQADKWLSLMEQVGGHEWTPAEEVLEAVKVVMAAGVTGTYSGIDELLNRLKRAAERVEEASKIFRPTPAIPSPNRQGEA